MILDTNVENPLLKRVLSQDVTANNIFQYMKLEYNRLYSFQNKWPLHFITPESLAEAGFFYLQQEDRVQCSFCKIIICNWNQDNKPLREHIKKNPKCPFLLGQDGNIFQQENKKIIDPTLNNVCLSNAENFIYKPKHPRMSDEKRRLLTYSSWPLNKPESQQLAECGLYYTGVSDEVTCFFCGGTLGNWEDDDDPWFEHSKFYPNCWFLELAKKQSPLKVKTFTKSLIDKKPIVQNLSSTNSKIIQQALDIFPKDLVYESVKRRLGSDFSLQEICDDILELKQELNLQRFDPTTSQLKNDTHSASNIDILLCKVCMDRERGVVFQPCGHFVNCWNCANLISICPVCREPITHKIKTYIS